MDYRRVRIYIVLHFNSLTGETQPRMPMNGPYWRRLQQQAPARNRCAIVFSYCPPCGVNQTDPHLVELRPYAAPVGLDGKPMYPHAAGKAKKFQTFQTGFQGRKTSFVIYK